MENPGKADLKRLELDIKAGKLPANAQFALQTPVTVGGAAEQPVSHYQGPEAESEGGYHKPAEPQTWDACAGAPRKGELRLIDICFQ